MRGKKVTAIKRESKKHNDGEAVSGGDLRILKKLNKNNSISSIENGHLFMSEDDLPVTIKPLSQLKHLTYLRGTKTVGILSKQLGR